MNINRFSNGNGDHRPPWEQDDEADQVGLDPADAVETPEPKPVAKPSEIKRPAQAAAPKTTSGTLDPVKVTNALLEVWTNPDWHCSMDGDVLICETFDKARGVKRVLRVQFKLALLTETPLVSRK